MRPTLLFVFTSLALLSSCARVKISDDPWCIDAGARGCYGTTTVSGQRFHLNKYQWDKLRVGQVCTATLRPGEGYKNIKVPLEKLCADSNLCTPEQKAQLAHISALIDGALGDAAGSPVFSNGTFPPAKIAPQGSIEGLPLQPEN